MTAPWTLYAVAEHLGATVAEVMDAATITLGEAQDAAIAAGLDPHMDYMRVPLVTPAALPRIAARISAERAELARMERTGGEGE
ncbi:hypothetical protein [Rhodococcus ruber]|uniref:hypothetical protein n=1 Tax=Rhodococcus ruber TaxID=1830 RepID=UPI001F366F03|nr:hypothetical protein [Rhodococcus ruber]MCF8783398.1 hypothetical protein [Rhodococcus ruber]